MDFKNWEISDYAAWWGAIIATLALLWNIIIALKKGPRIIVRVNPNMEIFPGNEVTRDKKYIAVTAINKGTAQTTITHFCGYHVKKKIDRYRKMKRNSFIINVSPLLGNQLPYVLKPGEEWINFADQQDLLDNHNNGYFYLGIIHNQRNKPIYIRVKLNA